jgi:aminoglycoside 2'-N-acetyltransferase I
VNREPGTTIRRATSDELTGEELAALHALFDASWPDADDRFTQDDFDHAMGGVHFLIEADGAIVSHASVVERRLEAGGVPLRTGYVEGVATLPGHRGLGHATAVMQAAGRHIDETFELGALGTEIHAFYGRLGWVVWEGPTFVRTEDGLVPTPEEDGYVLFRLTPSSPTLDPSAPISCEWRSGDVW